MFNQTTSKDSPVWDDITSKVKRSLSLLQIQKRVSKNERQRKKRGKKLTFFLCIITCACITVVGIRYCLLAQVRLVVPNTVFSQRHQKRSSQALFVDTTPHSHTPTFAASQRGDFFDHGVADPSKVTNCAIQSSSFPDLQKRNEEYIKPQWSFGQCPAKKIAKWI